MENTEYTQEKTVAIVSELKKDFTKASLCLGEMRKAEDISNSISDTVERFSAQASIWEARHKVYDALCEFVLNTTLTCSQKDVRVTAYCYKELNMENKSMTERYGILETEGDGWGKLIVFGEEMAQWASNKKPL